MTRKVKEFATESALCEAFIAAAIQDGKWSAYPETASWDVLLSRKSDGLQIGIQAKLVLNAKVVDQALPRWVNDDVEGPDHRAVLVPAGATGGFVGILDRLGIALIRQQPSTSYSAMRFNPYLPFDDNQWWHGDPWHHWCPVRRHKLPEYVPDVAAGASAPLKLTDWKVRAIKLAILLEERPVTKLDMKALGLNASRWVDKFTGWLTATPNGYVASERMPRFAENHPANYSQIKAEREAWMQGLSNGLI